MSKVATQPAIVANIFAWAVEAVKRQPVRSVKWPAGDRLQVIDPEDDQPMSTKCLFRITADGKQELYTPTYAEMHKLVWIPAVDA